MRFNTNARPRRRFSCHASSAPSNAMKSNNICVCEMIIFNVALLYRSLAETTQKTKEIKIRRKGEGLYALCVLLPLTATQNLRVYFAFFFLSSSWVTQMCIFSHLRLSICFVCLVREFCDAATIINWFHLFAHSFTIPSLGARARESTRNRFRIFRWWIFSHLICLRLVIRLHHHLLLIVG